MDLERFHFYLLRLRNSSIPELICRTKQFFFIKKQKARLSKKKNQLVIPVIDFKNIENLQLPSFHGQTNERLVQKILAGKLFALNTNITAIKKFENTWRNTYFDDIKLSDEAPDIRSIWEPSRLQHIAILLHHVLLSENPGLTDIVKQFAKKAILQWIDENPFLYGPHYISAMECGLRIPLLFCCLKVLDSLKASESQIILDTLYCHAWWVSNRLSLYSSRGNHTVAEAVGLVFGGAVFRSTTEGRGWLKKGHELLKRELDYQILDDGGPAEQSLNYHRFVLDLFWFSIDFLEKNNLRDFRDFKERLIAAENFIALFKDSRGTLLSIGDSDDGYAIAPGIYPRRIYSKNKSQNIQVFSKTGYTIFRDENAVLTFDHGPLGMAPFYNHGHADALSITLSVGGQTILVDPGTYRYNMDPQFRKYFKSTRAHNTITIDGRDQAIQATGVIWSHPYNVELLRYSKNTDKFFISAMHDGYERLKEPVIHKREILFFDDQCFLIKDSFVGKGVHDYEINFHLHPNAAPIKNNRWWQINNEGERIYMRMLENENFLTICGSTDPIHGWYSPSYGKKLKCNVMSCRNRGYPHEIFFVTAICTEALIDTKKIKNILHLFE